MRLQEVFVNKPILLNEEFNAVIPEAGKRLAAKGIEISRVTKNDLLTAKKKIDPVLKKAGIEGYWSAGGAGSFDPEHPYGGGGRESAGDIDILIDPANLLDKFSMDLETYNSSRDKPLGAKAFATMLADEDKKLKFELSAAKYALANYMTKNGFPTDAGTLTVQYTVGNRDFSIDLILRPRSAWPLHTYDFTRDPAMRGGDLWIDVYPVLVKLASTKTFTDPKTGEEKGNLQFSPDRGIVDRDTNKVIAIDKDAIAKILIGPEATGKDIASKSNIRDALKRYPEKLAQLKSVL